MGTKDVLCVFDFEFRKIREELEWYKAIYFDKTVPIVTQSSDEITREASVSLMQHNITMHEESDQPNSEKTTQKVYGRNLKDAHSNDDKSKSSELELVDACSIVRLQMIQLHRYISFFA